MTHCRSATEMCRARCAEGRATMTTDASSTIMSWATAMTANDQYRLGSRASVCGAVAVAGAISVVVMGSSVLLFLGPRTGSTRRQPPPGSKFLAFGPEAGLQSERRFRFREYYTERAFRLSMRGWGADAMTTKTDHA